MLRGIRWLEEFADSKLIDACAGLFRERFLNPRMFGTPTDEANVKDILDNQMPSNPTSV